jgi:hypothetical protein
VAPRSDAVWAGNPSLVKGKLCALGERQNSLCGSHGEPLAVLHIRENDDPLVGIERVAVRVGPSYSAGRGHRRDAKVPISEFPLQYLLHFYQVGGGLMTVNAGLTGPAYRLSDKHNAGLVVLVLSSLEPDQSTHATAPLLGDAELVEADVAP